MEEARSIVLPSPALLLCIPFIVASAGIVGIFAPAAAYLAATFAVAILPTSCGALFLSLYADVAVVNCDVFK